MYRNEVSPEMSNVLLDDTDSFSGYAPLDSDNFSLKKNKSKQAARKTRRAEKQLAKGHTRAAERKLKKVSKIQGRIQQQQKNLLAAKDQRQQINNTAAVINASNPVETESLATEPGQIGTEAGAVTMPSAMAAKQSMGGGGGDISSDTASDMNTVEDGSSATPETSTSSNPKELPGVTVSTKKNNYLIIALVVGIAILAFIFLPKLIKK